MALEESSSSQSANRIQRITQGAGDRCSVHLFSGSSFLAPISLIDVLDLAVDTEIDQHTFIVLERAEEALSAIDKAQALLASRDHSEYQLRQKLAARKFPVHAIDHAITYCFDHGFLDDMRFARRWLESRIMRKNEGIIRLKAGLSRTGVDRMTVNTVIDALPDSYEDDALRREIESREAKSDPSPVRIARRLSTLGFRANRIQEYLEKKNFED